MSSTDNKDYGELEQSMWQRFQDAEATPGPEVWSRIDHALAMQENVKYKKRALFYRQLAAACFILFILAGSALVLHFKQDQDTALLATSTQQQNKTIVAEPSETGNATIADNSTSSSASRSGSYSSSEPGNYSLQESGIQEIPAIVQAKTTDYNYATTNAAKSTQSERSSGIAQDNYSTENNAVATIKTGTTEANGLIAATIAGENKTEVTTGSETQVRSYMPAGQAIANVPDDYTSPSTINPLLRRNAVLGTATPESKSDESTDLQSQTGLALALNKPTESDKKDAAVTASRWNVGMGYGSTYFTQNINIPGYTVTPQQIFKVPSFGPPEPPKPSMSVESEENMRDARIEFKENTQAAMSFNVDAKAGFRIGKRLKMLTGIGYSQNSSKTKSSYIVEQFLFNPRTDERSKLKPTTVFLPSLDTFTTDSVSVVKTKQPFDVDYSYQMLSVPLGMQVEGSLSQKWFWYATGSMAVNFLMQTTIKSSLPEIESVTYSATDDSPFRKVQFSGNLGMGVGKRISNAVTVSVGPEYRSFFNSMLTDDKAVATQGRPYTLGLNMGVNYILGHDGK